MHIACNSDALGSFVWYSISASLFSSVLPSLPQLFWTPPGSRGFKATFLFVFQPTIAFEIFHTQVTTALPSSKII